ncbi:MAG: hypothetical protein JWQ43_1112 [Glaciihabitans sp.]|nr:hypothetical protein [Glaciihabitans sp.]
MFIAAAILSSLLAAGALFSAFGKLSKTPQVITSLTSVGLTAHQITLLAVLEILGAIGVVVGLFLWAPIGIAATIGLVIYFIGAVVAHLRIKDTKGAPAPAVFLLLAVITLVLRLLSF